VSVHFESRRWNDQLSLPEPAPAPDAGSFLRDQRVSRSLTTVELARQLGVHPTSVLRWERRERLPGPTHIHALARSLSVDTAAVAGFFDAVRPPAPPPHTNLRGHGLRPLRRAARVPAIRIAEVVGVPPASVYNWEAGRARIPVRLVPALADLLEVEATTLRELLDRWPAVTLGEHPGSELRRLRRRTGLSQERVAQRIGVSRHSLSAWERGKRPPLADVRRLAELYGVEVATVARAAGVAAPRMLNRRRWAAGDLADVLVALRQWAGISQRDLAEQCRRSVSTVRAWERGRGTPLPSSRRRLERLYQLPEGALLTAYPAPA
jgi:transcriptional regulator with XRE-family HTH domain